MHREGQELPLNNYFRLQEAIDTAEYVEIKDGVNLIYYHKDGDMLVAVVKASADRVDNWLVSLRRGNKRELQSAIKSGRALKW